MNSARADPLRRKAEVEVPHELIALIHTTADSISNSAPCRQGRNSISGKKPDKALDPERHCKRADLLGRQLRESRNLVERGALVVEIRHHQRLLHGVRRRLGVAVGRGALISMVLVMTVLPQLIVLCDKLIEKTTFRVKIKEVVDQ